MSVGMAGKREEVDRRILELLVCPLTKATLTFDEENGELISRTARLAYPIRDGIPILLPSEARALDDAPHPPPRPE